MTIDEAAQELARKHYPSMFQTRLREELALDVAHLLRHLRAECVAVAANDLEGPVPAAQRFDNGASERAARRIVEALCTVGE